MATRIVAASFLAVSVLVAWLTITEPFAARLLQLLIVVSIGYVGWLAWHGARVIRDAHAEDRGDPTGRADGLPFVSIVLPASNEESVIGAAVSSLCAQRYAGADGKPRYELVVVDDGSTDRTADRATEAAAGAPHVIVRRREREPGPRTKGAVLAWVHSTLRGDVVGAIDADTLVEPGFLERTMRAWERDRGADAIQVAREPRNASVSWLTRAQGEEQLMDLTSQCGRWSTDGTAELRGNGMFVRRAALEAIGGWNPRALTEDLDLSTRLVADGRHVTLAPDVAVTEEAVEALGALWRQRLAVGGRQPASPPRARAGPAPRPAAAQPQGRLPCLRRRVPRAATVRRDGRREPGDGPAAASRRLERSGRPVPELRHRHLPARPRRAVGNR